MVAEVRSDYASEYQAITAVAQMLGIGSPETIRTWIRRQQVDAGDRPGVTADAAEEIKRLKRENAELRRANDSEGSLGFLRGRTRPATEAIVGFIADHKDRRDGGLRWGVESICAVLTQHGCKIAPSTYYDARARRPTRQEIADEQWKPIVLDTWRKHRRVLGARKLWLRLRRDGHDIARCTVERLMRELGIAGVRRGKRKQPVDGALRETRPADLVDRHFSRFRTNQLWVADFERHEALLNLAVVKGHRSAPVAAGV